MSGCNENKQEEAQAGNEGVEVIAAFRRADRPGAGENEQAKATEEMIRSFFVAANLAQERVAEINRLDAELEKRYEETGTEVSEDDPLSAKRRALFDEYGGTPIAILTETYPDSEPRPADAIRRRNRILVLTTNEESAHEAIGTMLKMYLDRSEGLLFQTFENAVEGRESRPFFERDGPDEVEGRGGGNESILDDYINNPPRSGDRPLLTYCTTYEDAMAFITECMSLGGSFVPGIAAGSA